MTVPKVVSTTHLLSEDQRAIAALCTPQGSGAIAVIRICGTNAVDVVDKISRLSGDKKLSEQATHTIHHGYVTNVAANEVVDEVLFLLMKSPRTFTGQDTVEINCHNNPFIIEKILSLLMQNGVRQAARGEFTKRAFLSGKIDLVQAESINELIHAQTEHALRKSMSQLQGSLSQFMAKIEANLLELLSFAEASFEFLDEEQRDLDFDEKLRQKIALLLINLQEIKVNFNQQQQIRQGIRIALIGAVNAGKSTLFNSLVRKDRAIVTPVAGTTRDSIEFSLYRDGAFWLVIDTAGLRQTGDFIEQQGIERSLQEANTADVVLLVIDASAKLTPEQIDLYKELSQKYVGKLIFVANKIDAGDIGGVASLFDQHFCAVSAKTKQGLDELEFAIAEKIQKLFNQLNSPYILNQRQYQLISEIEHKLESIECNNQDGIQYELIAYHLKEALERLSDLTGRNVTEKVLDKVFDEFCVGK